MKVFSEEIFKRDFPFEGAHLVAASAGTGKTHNIQNIYARLVAERGITVDKLLVMTYTEAATKELKERIRTVLVNVLAKLTNDAVVLERLEKEELERLEKLVGCLKEDGVDAAKKNLERALMEFDQATISTIHGFCHRALSRYAFETMSAFGLDVCTDQSAELDRLVADWWHANIATIPSDMRQGMTFNTFKEYVEKIAGRSEPVIVADKKEPKGFFFLKAEELANLYKARIGAREAKTYDELLTSLRDAIRHEQTGPNLIKWLREDYQAVLVDEFQDTDPVQYEIFDSVYVRSPQRHPVFFVGDPKQSIYAFRGGDVFTYRKAASSIAEDKAYHLDTNYRSTARLVEAVNEIFKDMPESDQLKVGKDVAPLLVDGKPDPCPFRVVECENGSREECLVESVLEVLQDGQILPKDIAILVNSHKEGRAAAKHLRQRGVPAILRQAGNVFSSEAAKDLLAIMRAIDDSTDSRLVRTAMLSRYFKLTPSELMADVRREVEAEYISLFRDLKESWLKNGFESMFRILTQDSRCEYKVRFAAMPNGERLLADVSQIVELLAKATGELGPTPGALIDWLSVRIANAGEGKSEDKTEAYLRELESEANAVKIMTVHVSKGLQFPVVFVYLPNGTQAPDVYGSHDGDSRLMLSPSKSDAYAHERTDELRRMLYVAMTRAKRRTVVVLPISKRKQEIPLPTRELLEPFRNPNEDPKVLWRNFFPKDEGSLPDYSRQEDKIALAPHVPPPEGRFSNRPDKGSYSSLAPTHEGGEPKSRDDNAELILNLPGGAKVGNCWHSILEELSFSADAERIRDAVRESLANYGLLKSERFTPEQMEAEVEKMIRRTLDYSLTSPTGGQFSLTDVSDAERVSEWEFDFSTSAAAARTTELKQVLEKHWAECPDKTLFLGAMKNWDREIPHGFMQGFLDLVFRHGDVYYIVDWKSNRLGAHAEDYGAGNVMSEMANAGYFVQYVLYSVVLHRYLKETLGDAYSWERNFGGVRYYFLRGVAVGNEEAVFSDRPGEALLEELGTKLGL